MTGAGTQDRQSQERPGTSENGAIPGEKPGTTRSSPDLKGVEETLFIPLWARAVETRRQDGIIRDPYALRILQDLEYDFSRFDKGWASQVGIAVRTWLFDREVSLYLDRHPRGTVVILGCGLDARSLRLDNGRARFIDLDLPDVIKLRNEHFPCIERHETLARSVLDLEWLDRVPAGEPPLFVAEGLFMYLPEADLKRLMTAMAERFPGATILIESLSRRRASLTHKHDVVSKLNATFVWGVDSGRELESWHPRIVFEKQWPYLDFAKHRWGWMRYVRHLRPARDAIKLMRLRFAERQP